MRSAWLGLVGGNPSRDSPDSSSRDSPDSSTLPNLSRDDGAPSPSCMRSAWSGLVGVVGCLRRNSLSLAAWSGMGLRVLLLMPPPSASASTALASVAAFGSISRKATVIFHLLLNISYQPFFPKRLLWSSHPIKASAPLLLLLELGRVQQSDETPMMIWEMLLYLYVLYSPDWHYRSTMPTFLFLYAVVFAMTYSPLRLDVLFKVQYILLYLLCIPRMYKYYIHNKDSGVKRIAKLYVATIFLGGLCWFVDRFFCKKLSSWYINPQGHAWWHVFMGFNSYLANAFLMFCRAQQLGWNPHLAQLFGLFPYVRIEKTKTR